MKYYIKVMDMVTTVVKYIVSAATFVMIVVTFVEIIRRYFFGATWIWSEELIRYLIIWSGFIGGAAAYRHGLLVCFDMVTSKFTQRTMCIVNIINNTIALVFVIYLFYFGMVKIMSPALGMQMGFGLRIPLIIPYMSIPIGMFLIILFSIENYLKYFSELKGLKKNVGVV